MTPITPEQLAEWRQLAEKATAEPWYNPHDDEWAGAIRCAAYIDHPDSWRQIAVMPEGDDMMADFDFIAASRVAVPALLAEVERLTHERDALREAGKQAREALERNPNNARIQVALVALNAVLGPKETYG